MFEDRIREICLSLDYEPEEFLLNSRGRSDVSVVASSAAHGKVVVRFRRAGGGEVSGAKGFANTQRWNTGQYAAGYVTGPLSAVGGALDPHQDEQLQQEIALRWSLGVMAGGSHLAPVIEFGHSRKYIYQVRPHYPITLNHLIEKQVSPNHAVLFRIVDQIWAALAFLHQTAVNQPHGALSTHNVAFTSSRVVEADVRLLDLEETAETRRAEMKRKDFQDFGMLIYQLACALDKPVDAVDAAMRCPNASWKQLGGHESDWKALVKRLLEADSFPPGYDLAGARERLLAPLLPAKTACAVVAKPRPVVTAPPYRQGEQEPDTKLEVDYRGEIERLLEQGDHLGAIRLLLVVPADFQPREQVMAWGERIADQAGDELGGNTEFLSGLEQLATQGCQRAGLRLGRTLAKNQPAEALSWLAAASDAGLAESYFYIAGIYEHGGEDVPQDCGKALEFYQASLDHHKRDDWDVAYRMAAMILREKTLSDRLPLAIQLLDICHANGHYRSTDLLAQCHAQGLGVEADEKKAFQLFVDSWNRSKKCNEHYHTASNNLGVCFAIGFGTRKDPAMARHYFKQGEIAGHEASKKNLHSLAQGG